MMEEAHLRVLVGLAARQPDLVPSQVVVDQAKEFVRRGQKAQKEVDQILDSETGEDLGASTWPGKKALSPEEILAEQKKAAAQRAKAYRERKKGEK